MQSTRILVCSVLWVMILGKDQATFGWQSDSIVNATWIGEYEGTEVSEGSKLGLHLTVLPEDLPVGRVFQRGLPATGWKQGDSILIEGRKGEGYWQLEGHGYKVFIAENQMSVAHEDGRRWRLQKIRRSGVTMHRKPPPNAIVLFSQSGEPNQLEKVQIDESGALAVGAETAFPVQAFEMHLEFRVPVMAGQKGQQRGNSGIYIQQRYEVQILDSFGLEPTFDGCASLYRQRSPDINCSLAPGEWQTYDLYFEPPVWSDDGHTKLVPARISVIHNGVPVHYRQSLKAKTGAGQPEGPIPLPIRFQDHGDPVLFRNVWLVHRECVFP